MGVLIAAAVDVAGTPRDDPESLRLIKTFKTELKRAVGGTGTSAVALADVLTIMRPESVLK